MLNQSTNAQVSSLLRKRVNIAPKKRSLCAGKRSLCAGFLKQIQAEKSVQFAPEK
jgi:hypothetical protein